MVDGSGSPGGATVATEGEGTSERLYRRRLERSGGGRFCDAAFGELSTEAGEEAF